MLRRFTRLLAATVEAGDTVPDAELLRQFAQDRNAAAFELLVRRHADTVWTPCRRIVRSDVDAEDAFQATFLIFARKAAAIRGACVGGWLHRVAVRVALKSRARAARDPVATSDHLSTVPAPEGPDPELAGIVQEELARLPDRYRLPVVLCDLEGRTHVEAAVTLRCPVGTVAGRLSRARALLRDRLARRGVAPVLILSASTTPAGVVRAAAALAGGGSAVRPVVSSLTEGVLHAMSTAKWKMVAGATAGLLGLAGAAITAYGSLQPAPAPPMPAPAAPPQKVEPAPKAKTNAELLQEAKDRFAEFEQLWSVISEAELLKHRRDINAAGQPGKEDAVALTKKVAELERQIENLKPRLKYYSDGFGLSSPSKLPQVIKLLKDVLDRQDKLDSFERRDGVGGSKSPDLKPVAADDLKRLTGDWKVVSLEANGKKAPAAELEGMRWSFSGTEVRFTDPGEEPGGKTSVKLDPTQSPKHIDLVTLEGKSKGTTSQGIYKLEKDRLVICLRDPSSAEKGRPTTFVPGALSELGLITLERVQDKK
ncbi:sigma-70 family RNA polymerase sigma factor [Gemmata sp. G18]|uniref:Sigma-70 family RNA polymerase sigma factor n=1 Tax=Gemmata palustris TaxID=2822762 RepID=A0ABS5BPU4_9BACT|nr:sigma-70 family RNA polymerase sigma factor [Gemmata palustris]MBP3955746.1 sigma-70 family RNA polymerase sigma factor [Gemmata palustris]